MLTEERVMEYQAFAVEYEGNIAHVKLNRPDALNTMNVGFPGRTPHHYPANQ